MAVRCTYVRCDQPAVKKLELPWGRPWYGCTDHYPAMAEALKVGQPQSCHLEVTDLPAEVAFAWD